MKTVRDGKHLLDYWAILLRRRWVIYLGVVTVTLVALFGSFLATPLYRSTTTIQIERQNPDILTFRDLSRTDYSWAAYSDFYQTQYKILASDAVSRRAAQRLDIASHPVFESRGSKPGLIARIKSLIPRRGSKVQADPMDAAASFIRAGLEISPVRNSQLVEVSWISDDPELSAEVANAVADAYIQHLIEAKYSTSDQASEFLVNQIGTLKEEIAAIEDNLQRYGESKSIITIDDTNNITMKALSDVAERRTAAETLLAEKEAQYLAVRDASPDALPQVLQSDLISQLRTERARYEAELSQKTRIFKDDWPQVQSLRSKMAGIESRIESETREIARKVVLTAESEYLKARQEVRNLDVLLSNQEEAAQRLKRDAVEFANLRSEVRKKRETLDKLISRQNEMALSTRLRDMDVSSSNIQVVERARVPVAPFRPNTSVNIALGLFLGLGLGIGAAFFLDYLDNTLSTPEEVEAVTSLATLVTIPRLGDSATRLVRVRRKDGPVETETVELIAHRDSKASASEAYRELRTSILLSNPGSAPATLMVTSAVPEEGKSATAVNLAIVLSQMGKRVVIVDTDLRRPRLHKVFSRPNSCGASSYLSGMENDPLHLIATTDVEGLDLLPSGPIPPNPSELLNSPMFAGLGGKLIDGGYDHVVFDSPPALSVADPAIIANVVDAMLLVVRAESTPRQSVRQAVEKLSQTGANIIGIVLNDLRASTHGYGRYRYHYHTPESDKAAGTGTDNR